jgi:superfamily II DNA or RNA helicase
MQENQHSSQPVTGDPVTYVLKDFKLSDLSTVFILKHSAGYVDTAAKGFFDLYPESITINSASFADHDGLVRFPRVKLVQEGSFLKLSCACPAVKSKLCDHQSRVLFNLMDRKDIRIFFDQGYRHDKIRFFATAYGLENEQNPDAYFAVNYTYRHYEIVPLIRDLLPVSREKNNLLREVLLPEQEITFPADVGDDGLTKKILILKQHRYYGHFQVDLIESVVGKSGKLKNPLKQLNPADYIWMTENVNEVKFYTAISKFQQNYEPEKAEVEINKLKALVSNPLRLDVFYHDPKISANLTLNAVKPVDLKNSKTDIVLSVSLKNSFYTITGELILADKSYDLKMLNIKFKYFLYYNQTLHLIDNPDFLRVIDFFRQNNNHLVIHKSRFSEFQDDVLSKLEHRVHINYSYLKTATPEQLSESSYDHSIAQLIYLSRSENYIMITPVMKYGTVEVPVLSRKKIQATDQNGQVFVVTRDQERELKFIADLTRQHPYFAEQEGHYSYALQHSFYLHKKHFLDENWFLNAFEQWRDQSIEILGFNALEENGVNPNRMKITMAVNSGLNWFDTAFEVKFGDQKVSLKQLHRAIRNKKQFIKLGDGTLGILPQEWIDKLTLYFHSGEIIEESIRVPKINFSAITELYEEEILSAAVKIELSAYQEKIESFKNIQRIEVPAALKGTLRNYQKEGLNWLNFLDEFGFGGCLADDMGLGKTITVIAFILSQRNKGHQNTNLIVVPTTLIFNWQTEVSKFAPDLKVHTIHGAGRSKNLEDFSDYEIILTSYGTLLYDVAWLKKYCFNYIFLDESQTIKNPESLRYRAARLLQSRNKIAITGTPVENNTFDLYGQLSFACPGLLGSKQFFKDHYAIPIDKFKDNTRAIALKAKVSPFILRRTKNEVVEELPDKTEMIIYCEMGAAQKNAYDACKNEYIKVLKNEEEEHTAKHTLHMLKGLTQLRQICNSPSLLKQDLLHGATSSKIDTLMEEIDSHSPQHKILVFSQFVSMLDLIKKELEAKSIPFEYLTGKTGNREKRVKNFQENEGIRVFLISLKAGGTGLNLTQADYVYIVDPWWNPAVENQAIDRCYRIGQKKNVIAVRLICPDTIEEKIMKLQETKKELVGDIIQTDTGLLKSLSKKDLISLFS